MQEFDQATESKKLSFFFILILYQYPSITLPILLLYPPSNRYNYETEALQWTWLETKEVLIFKHTSIYLSQRYQDNGPQAVL